MRILDEVLLAITVRRLLGLCGPVRAVADNQASAMIRTCTCFVAGLRPNGSTRRENAAKADSGDLILPSWARPHEVARRLT